MPIFRRALALDADYGKLCGAKRSCNIFPPRRRDKLDRFPAPVDREREWHAVCRLDDSLHFLKTINSCAVNGNDTVLWFKPGCFCRAICGNTFDDRKQDRAALEVKYAAEDCYCEHKIGDRARRNYCRSFPYFLGGETDLPFLWRQRLEGLLFGH